MIPDIAAAIAASFLLLLGMSVPLSRCQRFVLEWVALAGLKRRGSWMDRVFLLAWENELQNANE
jgi:hypothetical protein